jgi:hypothetical protein
VVNVFTVRPLMLRERHWTKRNTELSVHCVIVYYSRPVRRLSVLPFHGCMWYENTPYFLNTMKIFFTQVGGASGGSEVDCGSSPTKHDGFDAYSEFFAQMDNPGPEPMTFLPRLMYSLSPIYSTCGKQVKKTIFILGMYLMKWSQRTILY